MEKGPTSAAGESLQIASSIVATGDLQKYRAPPRLKRLRTPSIAGLTLPRSRPIRGSPGDDSR